MARQIDNLGEAIVAATEAHFNQKRLDGEAFILHPLRVMFETGGAAFFEETEDMMIAAVMHDVVEDSYWQLSHIELRFGSLVAVIVDALTQRDGETYRAYIDRVAANPRACLIKRFDIMDNLRHVNLISDSMVRRYTEALNTLDEAHADHG